ncbi:MAG: decarboxylase [Gammaproteobacteria bacterium]|nr:decarboxylase [Gammaproteobacteria bacterium]MDH3857880.1 decarboxylase [Gammaproteobacteria bacterium]
MNGNQASSAIEHPSGAAIIDALKRAGIKFVVSVPDIVTSEGLLWPLASDPDLELLRVCKEDEGVSICGAMSYSGTRALLLMQQTGLMDSLNAIRAIGMDYQLPICMMVGLQGKEPELKPDASAAYGVRIVEPVLQAMDIPFRLIEAPADVAHITADIELAYRDSSVCCFLIGRSPTA